MWTWPTGTSSVRIPGSRHTISPQPPSLSLGPLCPAKQGQDQRAHVASGTEPASRPPGTSSSRLLPRGGSSSSEGAACASSLVGPTGPGLPGPRGILTSLLHSPPSPPVLLATGALQPCGHGTGGLQEACPGPPQGCSLTLHVRYQSDSSSEAQSAVPGSKQAFSSATR